MTSGRAPATGNSPASKRPYARIEVESLRFTYAGASAPSLDDISLRIGEGEFVALAGANNAGKSTLCLALAGVIPHLMTGVMQGRVRICGNDTSALSVTEMAAHTGFVMQKPEQQLSGVRFTVREEVAFGLENRGVERHEMLHRVNEALRTTGLDALADHSPHHLSGGQLQRVMLAAAVAGDTPLLVLDEPTTFLDPAGEEAVLNTLRRLCDAGHTIVLSGARLDGLARHADRVVALHEGRLVLDGTPREVLTSALMRDIGLDWPRCTRVASLAAQHGLWRNAAPPEGTRPLAITLEETLDGLGEAARQPGKPPRPATGGRATSAGTSESGIEMENVRFRYGTGPEVLTDISLRIGDASQSGPGEAVALLGRNGSGKSTLVRHFNGLLKPDQGVVRVNGQPTTRSRVAHLARHVALLFQNPDDQICKGTVLDEASFGPRNLGYARDRVQELAHSALAALGLDGMHQRNPYDLGLSERKRLAIASVLAMDTGIVVLDEPTAGLDQRETNLLEAAIRHLTAAGRSVVVISHDMDFVAENLTRAVCLEAGRIRYDGPVTDLFAEDTILEQCSLIPPQVARLAAACGVRPATVTPEALIDCLRTKRREPSA